MKFTPKTIDKKAEARLVSCLEEWKGTKYRAGKQIKGIACDCRSFVLGALDDLYGTKTDITLLPEDSGLHQPEIARKFLRDMARMWNVEKVHDRQLEPGDLIVTAYPGGGPTHIIMSGAWPWIYHATKSSGVRKTGMGFDGLEFYGHYRLPGKETWH